MGLKFTVAGSILVVVVLALSWIGTTSLSSMGLYPRGNQLGGGLSSHSMRGKRPNIALYMAKERNYNTFVKVKSNFEAQTILEHDENCSLKDYMRLPVDQYVCIKMPLNAKLQRLNDNFFNLTVPPVTFFNLQVSPTVQCIVSQTQDAVVIESDSVHLGGSPYVESLNGCFKIRIQTIFNWVDREDYKSILSRSSIDVDVDPPAPFKYFGKRVLETTGTLAMSIALGQIENAFVTNLGDDYSRWALDSVYRKTRAAGACEVPEGEEGVGCPSDERGVLPGGVGGEDVLSGQRDDIIPGGVGQGGQKVAVSSVSANEAREITTGTGLKSEVPAVNVAKKLSFPNVEPEGRQQGDGRQDQQGPVALRDIPVRQQGSGTETGTGDGSRFDRQSWEQEQVEDRRREKEAAKTLNTGLDSPNPGIPIPFTAVAEDESPASLLDDVCLVPGEPIVRVEEAPDNARRIFTGIDITAEVEDVWAVLTDYDNLGKVIPSLVKNDVLERRASGGARLSQVGGAKILPGLTFTAKTVLDVEIYTEENPIPVEMTADHLPDAPVSTAGDKEIRDFDRTLALQRGVFPRPYAITQLKHRDITMQNVEGLGDFEHYQGIWRLQRLPNCAPDGGDACRLTYAVELRPKGFLPVGLIEGRIAGDLKNNLDAIRRYVQGTSGQGRGVAGEGKSQATTRGGRALEVSTEAEADQVGLDATALAAAVETRDTTSGVRGLSLGQGEEEEDRVGLESVIAAIKLAQISEITRGGVLSPANGSAAAATTTAIAAMEDEEGASADPRGDAVESASAVAATEMTGDEISPKKWSYRRLLVTGSGFARSEFVSLAERNQVLRSDVSRLQREVEEADETLRTIERIVPAEYVPSALLSSARLVGIKSVISEYSDVDEGTAGRSADGVRDSDASSGGGGGGRGEGDFISKKKWSYRRLLVTGSGFVKSDSRDLAGENRDLEERRNALEARLAARNALLAKITQMSESPGMVK